MANRIVSMIGALFFVLAAGSVYAQEPCGPLSPNAQAALHWFTSAEPFVLPAPHKTDVYIYQGVARNLGTLDYTYKIESGSPTVQARFRVFVRFWAALLNHPSCSTTIAFTEVFGSTPAKIVFKQAKQGVQSLRHNGTTQELLPFPVSKGANMLWQSLDQKRYDVIEIIAADGTTSQFLINHEGFHAFAALWHTSTSGSQLVGIAHKAALCNWNNSLTPEQNAADPCWEPTPGFWPAMRHVVRLEPGTVLQ